MPQTVSEIEAELKERDALHPHIGLSSPLEAPDSVSVNESGVPKSAKPYSAPRLDKLQIQQRIEEDRERHKRLREHQWAVLNEDDDAEFERLWDETSSLNSDDYQAMEEESDQRDQCAREHAEEMEAIHGE